RLHRRDPHELQQMVLEDVPDRARLLVVARAAFDPDRLGDGDLDVVDELAVPDRLEDAVREAQREHVLDGLLAEVVVDAEDLVLREALGDQPVQVPRRREIEPERLLDDQPHPTLTLAPLGDLLHEDLDRARRDREVEDAVPQRPALAVHLAQHPRQLVLAGVVGGAEDDEDARLRATPELEPLEERVRLGRDHARGSAPCACACSTARTACPPNWLRSAAFTFAANDSSWRDANRANSAAVITG